MQRSSGLRPKLWLRPADVAKWRASQPYITEAIRRGRLLLLPSRRLLAGDRSASPDRPLPRRRCKVKLINEGAWPFASCAAQQAVRGFRVFGVERRASGPVRGWRLPQRVRNRRRCLIPRRRPLRIPATESVTKRTKHLRNWRDVVIGTHIFPSFDLTTQRKLGLRLNRLFPFNFA